MQPNKFMLSPHTAATCSFLCLHLHFLHLLMQSCSRLTQLVTFMTEILYNYTFRSTPKTTAYFLLCVAGDLCCPNCMYKCIYCVCIQLQTPAVVHFVPVVSAHFLRVKILYDTTPAVCTLRVWPFCKMHTLYLQELAGSGYVKPHRYAL